jgi:hypothetical protein
MYVRCPECSQPAGRIFEAEEHFRSPVSHGDMALLYCGCCGAVLDCYLIVDVVHVGPDGMEVTTDE